MSSLYITVKVLSCFLQRPDLLKPTEEPKASLNLIHDDVMVTDIAGLYSDKATDVPKEMKVRDLKERLAEGSEGFCLSEHQRKAVNQALSQALSLIHVNTCTYIVHIYHVYPVSGVYFT